jgi:hypothetical protein
MALWAPAPQAWHSPAKELTAAGASTTHSVTAGTLIVTAMSLRRDRRNANVLRTGT